MNDPEDPIELRYRRMLENGLKRIQKAKISPANKQIIFDFINKCHADGLGIKRIVKLIGMVRALAEWLGKDFDKADKKDIISLLAKIEKRGFRSWTIWSYKRVVKKLYKFLDKLDLVNDIRVARKDEDRIKTNEVLQQEDIEKLLKATNHPRDRALIAVLAETGARLEEMQRMLISSINFGNPQCIISVPGVKDSPKIRELPLEDSIPGLKNWLQMHPYKDNPDHWLWISLSTNRHGKQLGAHKIHKILADAKEKAGITKPCFPHAFRHARATFLGQYFTESQLCWWFGWRVGSKMAATYVHTARSHVVDAWLKLKGLCLKCKKEKTVPGSDYCEVCIKNTNGKADNKLAPKKCPRCFHENESVATFCQRCGASFNPRERLSKEGKEREQIINMLEELIERKLNEKLKAMGLQDIKL